jgi:hypothetical protein
LNRPLALLLAAAALLAGIDAHAALVRVEPDAVISLPGDAPFMVAQAVNSSTGESAVCYATPSMVVNVDTVRCARIDAQGNPPASWFSHSYSTTEIVLRIDTDIADDGRVYAGVVTQVASTSRVWLHGWNSNGATLFNPQLIFPTVSMSDVDVTATPGGFWAIYTGQSFFAQSMQTFFSARDLAGNQLHDGGEPSSHSPISQTCAPDTLSDIAGNRSGDFAVVWIQPNTSDYCHGTVMVQTFRTFFATSPRIALTTVVQDAGNDVSPNRAPRVHALDDGRFVVFWADDISIRSATIGPSGGILSPATLVTPIGNLSEPFTTAANPLTGDYAVTRRPNPTASCTLPTRLAFDADLVPLTSFSAGSCAGVSRIATAFERGGNLRVAKTHAANVTLSRVLLPAQIEVNNVVVSEGDPAAGAPPVAALSATLTRPHPNGEDVQVTYFTRNGTALAGQDFAQTRETAVFSGAAQETARTLLVPLLPDTDYEDDEGFSIDYELPVNAVIRKGEERSSVVIRDDDHTPPIAPDCDDDDPLECRTVPEPGPGESTEVLVTLEMAQPIGVDLHVSYATANGTALAGSDYSARSGQVQIVAGATTAVIPLTVLGDDVPEDTKTFHLRLTAPAGVTLSADDLVIHILDDAICFLEVSPPDIVTDHPGSDESLSVTTRDGCAWSVSTPDDWIAITSPVDNTGSGTISLTVAPFDPPAGVFERSGSVAVTLADPARTVVVPVDQDGDCSFTRVPESQHFGVSGGSGAFAIDASVEQCAWTVTSPVPWITILSPLEPVFGDGTVSYRIDPNVDLANVETGLRSVALHSEQLPDQLEVSQDGCTYALDSNALSVAAAGDVSYSVDLDTQSVCRWTAVSHTSWILIEDGASGTGEGSVEVFVLDNPTVQTRIGTVSIGDETLTVTQDGIACDYALGPASIASCPDGRAFSLAITATDGCAWTLHSDAPWAEVTSATSGSGDDVALGLLETNLSEQSRSATVQLRAQNIGVAATSLLQEGYLTYELFDAARPGDWSYQPDAAWSVAAGTLLGVASPPASAIALDQATACRECEVSARVAATTASSSASEVLAVLGWYRDAANHVGLAMDEFSNRWILFQRVNGTRFAVSADVGQILPNAYYDVHVVFDGTTFVAELDGQPLLQMPLQGDSPLGSAGFQVTGGGGRLAELRVNLIEAGAVPPLPTRLFGSGFESGETPIPPDPTNASQCRLGD